MTEFLTRHTNDVTTLAFVIVAFMLYSAVKEPVVMGKYKACGVFNRMTAFVIFWASFGVLVHGGLGVFMLVTKPKELQGIVIQAAAMMFAIAGAELGIIVALSLYFRKKCPAFLKRGLYFKMLFCGLGVFIKGVFLGIPLILMQPVIPERVLLGDGQFGRWVYKFKKNFYDPDLRREGILSADGKTIIWTENKEK